MTWESLPVEKLPLLPAGLAHCRVFAWRLGICRWSRFISHYCLSSSVSMRDVQKASLLYTRLHSVHPYWYKKGVAPDMALRFTTPKQAAKRTTLVLKPMGRVAWSPKWDNQWPPNGSWSNKKCHSFVLNFLFLSSLNECDWNLCPLMFAIAECE